LRFTARLVGAWTANTGTFNEGFSYAGGRRQQREWQLTRHSDGQISGTTDDIVPPPRAKSAVRPCGPATG